MPPKKITGEAIEYCRNQRQTELKPDIVPAATNNEGEPGGPAAVLLKHQVRDPQNQAVE